MNNIFLQKRYVDIISSELERYKVIRQDPFTANCRCFACGDSKKNKHKARGFFIEGDSGLGYYCQNCTKSEPFDKILKEYFYAVYEEYLMDKLADRNDSKPAYKPQIESTPIKRTDKFEPLAKLKKVSQLPNDHPCRTYVVDRQLPTTSHAKLYFAPKFYSWINEIVPGKFKDSTLYYDHPRLILPLVDQNGYCFGVQGRDLAKDSEMRYITILFDDQHQKIFGLNTMDPSKDVYILEGPIDSLFLSNAIAFAGIDGNVDAVSTKADKIIVLDNQPRNGEVLNKYYKYITQGHNVCIWPSDIAEKDVNDMVKSGFDPEEIEDIIKQNTFSGLTAELKFTQWKGL